MSAPIYPIAMIPKTNITFKLYFLAFPEEWKKALLKLYISSHPNFNAELYRMNTKVLYKYLEVWSEDIVRINSMTKNSDDSDWLISMKEPDAEKICEIIQ